MQGDERRSCCIWDWVDWGWEQMRREKLPWVTLQPTLQTVVMPTSQHICTSHGCAKKHTINERGVLLQGKRVRVQEYRHHHTCDKHLKYIESPLSPSAASTVNQSTSVPAQRLQIQATYTCAPLPICTYYCLPISLLFLTICLPVSNLLPASVENVWNLEPSLPSVNSVMICINSSPPHQHTAFWWEGTTVYAPPNLDLDSGMLCLSTCKGQAAFDNFEALIPSLLFDPLPFSLWNTCTQVWTLMWTFWSQHLEILNTLDNSQRYINKAYSLTF